MKKTLLTLAATVIGLSGYAQTERTTLKQFTEQSRESWVINGCSTANDGNDGSFAKMMDGSTTTYWHSDYKNDCPDVTTSPHFFLVDRGASAENSTVGGFGFQARTDVNYVKADGGHQGNGWVTAYRVYVTNSIDGLSFCNLTDAFQTGATAHSDLQTFISKNTVAAQGTFPEYGNSPAQLQQVAFDREQTGRYVLFVIDGVLGSNAANCAHCAEFYLYDVSDATEQTFIDEATPLINNAKEVVEGWKDILPTNIYNTLWAQVNVDPSTITTQDALNSITTACSNAINTAYDQVNGKVIYLYNHRSNKYLAANANGSNNTLATGKTELAKWLIVRNGSNNNFRLMNVETGKDIAAAPADQANHGNGRLFEIAIGENNNTGRGSAFRYADADRDNGLTIGGTNGPITNWWDGQTNWTKNDGGAPWTLSLTGSTVDDLTLSTAGQKTYYRIRSARALWTNRASLMGINTVVENGANVNEAQTLINRRDGLGALWTLNDAGEGKYYIRNAAADFEGETELFGITSSDSQVAKEGVIAVTVLAAQGAPNSSFNQGYDRALAIQTSEGKYMDTQNHHSWAPVVDGWDQINSNWPENGGVYYFEPAEDADEIIEAYKAQALANSSATYANNNIDYVLTMAPNVPVLYDGVDTEALSAVKVTAPDIVDVKTANAAATAEVEGLDVLNAALAKVDGIVASRYFAVRSVGNPTHMMSLVTADNGSSTARTLEVAEDATVNVLNHIWKLIPAGNNTYKLYNYGIHKNLGHKAVRTTTVEFESVDAGSAYTMERGPLWDKQNSVAFRMPESTPEGDNLLYDNWDDTWNLHRLVSWSNLAAGNTGAQWVIELIDFEPASSVKVGGFRDATEGWKLTFTGNELVKTEGLGAHHSLTYGNTPAKEETQPEENGAETYALEGVETVAPDDSRISVENGVATMTLDLEPGNYTINVPAGFFTVNNKLSEPFSADVTLHENGTVTSIGEVKAAVEAEAEYFDLNGRKVENPAGGIFVVRKGDKVVKQVIR